jgi:hypothetical protein
LVFHDAGIGLSHPIIVLLGAIGFLGRFCGQESLAGSLSETNYGPATLSIEPFMD